MQIFVIFEEVGMNLTAFDAGLCYLAKVVLDNLYLIFEGTDMVTIYFLRNCV